MSEKLRTSRGERGRIAQDAASMSKRLKKFAVSVGADLVGIADVGILKDMRTEPPDLLERFTRAISIGVRLSDGVIDPIVDRPTPLYQQHYGKVNALLDDIALRIAQHLQNHGGKAAPIPASQVLDKTEWYSYLSHKAVAVAAGIGWQGKSLLLVSAACGPRVRLVTILADLDLKPDSPVKNRCARCSACAEACPVGAIKNVNTKFHYRDREEALDFRKCLARVTENSQTLPFVEAPICGVLSLWSKEEVDRRPGGSRDVIRS